MFGDRKCKHTGIWLNTVQSLPQQTLYRSYMERLFDRRICANERTADEPLRYPTVENDFYYEHPEWGNGNKAMPPQLRYGQQLPEQSTSAKQPARKGRTKKNKQRGQQ